MRRKDTSLFSDSLYCLLHCTGAEGSTCICPVEHQFAPALPVPSTVLTQVKSSVNICGYEGGGRGRSLGVSVCREGTAMLRTSRGAEFTLLRRTLRGKKGEGMHHLVCDNK